MRLLFVCLLFGSVMADDLAESTLRSAFAAIDAVDVDQWQYTRQTTSTEEGVWLASHNPNRDPVWVLHSVDGEPPTKKQQKAFQKQREEREADEDLMVDMIRPGTVKETGTVAGRRQFEFEAIFDDLETSLFAMAELDAEGTELLSLTIRNIEPFSPAVAVKMSEFQVTMEFQPLEDFRVLETFQMTMTGKFAGVKTFDVDTTVHYSQFTAP